MSTGSTICSKFTMNVAYFCCQACNLIFLWVHQHALFRSYLISSVHASLIVLEMVKKHVDCYPNVENSGKCWQLNIPHVLVFYEHAMLFLLELPFQRYHQYVQHRGYLISFVHASFVEQKLVVWSNMQVFGSTCGSYGSNQY